MQFSVSPARKLAGSICLPGDKSISHRYGMLAALAEGTSSIENYSTGADCASTLSCMQALGAGVERNDDRVLVHGVGGRGLRQPAAQLDAGNSGSTIRMLTGILAAQPFESVIAGDESLARRPMDRIMKPLSLMGARIDAREGRFPPMTVHGGRLSPIRYELPVASAQVKTCVLFAGLYCDGETTVVEKIRTRDHTEIALRTFGADVESKGGEITLRGPAALQARQLKVPGDLSSAAFFLVAAMLVPGSELRIENVGLNPTRTALLDWLMAAGARIKVVDLNAGRGEVTGTLVVRGAPSEGGVIEGATTAALIDEIPVLAILGAASRNGLVVRDAAELRVKETDRIATVADNLQRMGVRVETTPDGFSIPGEQRFQAAKVDSFGDHRIAMAFAVAGLAADGETVIEGAEAASVSFPEFYDTLHQITGSR
jgi:3-phosphoshikimate 1-carboxyvinyltransferase